MNFNVFYDTTLRDGEQTPNVCFTPEQKLEIAMMLDEIGIGEIEAGFPVVSQKEFEAVKLIANQGLNARIFAFCRAKKEDIDTALRCDIDGIVIASSLSDLHLRHKLKRSFEEAFNQALELVEYASEHVFVSFTTEDSTRIPIRKLLAIYRRAIEHGADRIHLSDTVGVATTELVECYVTALKSLDCELLCHFHNDFGLATANSLRALMCGADKIATTVNGIGERCGNTCFQEVVMALEILYGFDTGIKLNKLYELSKLVERYSGIPIHPQAPVVGEYAFTHESGMHVAGILENPLTYEPYDPELVGRNRKIVLGKHSGRRSVEYVLREMNVNADVDVGLVLNIIKRIREEGFVVNESLLRWLVEGNV
jgi:methanogen homocitrate synthase